MNKLEEETNRYNKINNIIDDPSQYTTNDEINKYIKDVEVTDTMKAFIQLKDKFIRHNNKFEFVNSNNINEDLKIKHDSTRNGIEKLQNDVLHGNVDANQFSVQ
ncbi:20500_t:CDS:1, partial [Gigaspora margarita]